MNREPRMTSGDEDLCYKIMGLSSTASWQEVERAYRSKAKVHHPDHGGDEDTMRALNDAYTLAGEPTLGPAAGPCIPSE